MIKKLYNPWHISNPGEKEADKQLTVEWHGEEKPVPDLHRGIKGKGEDLSADKERVKAQWRSGTAAQRQ